MKLLMQPACVSDLRIVISAIEISSVVSGLEIMRYLKRRSTRQRPSLTNNKHCRMGNLVQSMIKHTLNAYIERDANKAETSANATEVDLLH